MKKFYEQPVVEITVFDVEDIITTSNNYDTTQATPEVAAFETALQNGTAVTDGGVKIMAYDVAPSSLNW